MLSIEERIARTKDKVRQLENQRKDAQPKESTIPFDVDTDRQTILGGIDTEHFPWLLKLQPQATEAENQVEFAQWDCFLALLSADVDYVNRLMKMVYESFPEGKNA